MPPSKKELERALVEGTKEVFTEDPDATSVNKVRKHVEEKLDLEEGFFATSDWKSRSKEIIKKHVEKLLDGDAPNVKDEAESKNGIKKEEKDQKPAKRKVAKKEEGVSDEDVKPKKKLAQRKKQAIESDEAASDQSTSSPSKKRKRSIKADPEGDPEDVKAEASDEEETKGNNTKEESDEGDVKDEAKDESDEYSDVIDVVPAPKRKKKSKDSAKASSSKPAPKKTGSPDDPQEAEIRKLQSQLTKCGVRKLWHNELKQYGDDARAKIRHLKKMLTDVGMDGRFSEAKAKEIKETRELLAEAEAAQEMNALWGMESGGRSSRHKGRGAKLVESDASGDEGGEDVKGDDDEEEEVSFAARRRRAQADLAFLGDDSDSD